MEYKTPTGVLDFAQDWSNFLSSDTISTSTWTVETGLTVDSDANTSTTATAVISGGTAGRVYKVQNTITTANGLTATETWFLTVKEQLV